MAKEGRPGPVLIDIPSDVLKMDGEFKAKTPEKPRCRNLFSDENIEKAAKIIGASKRPVILLGGGCGISGFTATTKWTAYEAIQSAVIEHVAVTAQNFGLRLFNDPSGTDVTTVNLVRQQQSADPAPASQK